ncbi:MAG: universal stress protein [Bryobacteraceae bacterium]
MLPFQRILFPVDYSDRCRSVVPYVNDMAEHFSAALTVVHAHGVGAPRFSDLDVADPEWPAAVRRLEEQRLKGFVEEAFPNKKVQSFIDIGEPDHVITKVVQHHGADLVMMPTHGHGLMRKLLLGSVTAKVLHDVSASVWTAGEQEIKPCSHAYKNIVCAVDLSEESEVIARAALCLAKSFGSKLTLAHVVEIPPPNLDVDFSAFKQDLEDAANFGLGDLKAKLNADVPHIALVSKLTADGVREAAVSCNADLIVVGRGRSQGGVSRIWSRLYNIVREAPCPVLSI